MHPEELGALVEEYSGSITFKHQCERLDAQIKKLSKQNHKFITQRTNLQAKETTLLTHKMVDENYRKLVGDVKVLRKKAKLLEIKNITDDKQKLAANEVVDNEEEQIEN